VILFNNVLNYQRVCKENNLHICEESLPCKQDHGGSITNNTTWDFTVDRFKGSVAAFHTPVG